MERLKLSVSLPNYNHADYLGESLQSLLNQSYKFFEVIIVDDGSTDNSVEVIEEYAKSDSRILLLRNDKNMGVKFSLRRILDHASGDYIYFFSADDKVLPGFFEKSMKLLSQYPQAGLCCSDPASFEVHGGPIYANRLYWSDKPCCFPPEDLAEIIQGGYIAGHTSIIKRSALLDAGGFIDDLKWHCDWFALLVIGFRCGVCYIPEPLATMRPSPTTYSASGRRNWSEQSKVLNHLLSLLKSPAYRDVLPYFARGSVMSHFGDEIVRMVMENPGHWDMDTMMLIQNPLWQWNLRLTQQQEERERKSRKARFENRVRSVFERGNIAIKQGRLDEACSIFKTLTHEFPKLANGHFALSRVEGALGDFQAAREAILKAIEINPNNPGFQNQLGIIFFQMGNHNEAEDAFRQALSIESTNVDGHINLAEVACAKGQYDMADRHYQQALSGQPDNVDLLVASGKTACKADKFEAALRCF